MRFVSKRRLRLVGAVITIVFLVSVTAKCVVHFQLNKEIEHYKLLFRTKKDNIQDIYDPLSIKQIPLETIDSLYELHKSKDTPKKNPINWERFAYVNYVTETEYLCNTLLHFKILKEKGTKAKLLLLLSNDVLGSGNASKTKHVNALLENLKAIAPSQVIIKSVDTLLKPGDMSPWNKSLTKLLVFNQTEYERIIYLDNDAALNDKMDELFFLPSYVKFAAPLAYWFLSESDLEDAKKEVQMGERKRVLLDNILSVLDVRVKKSLPIYNHLPSLPSSLYLKSKNMAKEILSSNSSPSPLFDLKKQDGTKKSRFTSNLMVINPSVETFRDLMQTYMPRIARQKEKYDTDVLNELYDFKTIIYDQFKLFRKLKTEFCPSIVVLPFIRYGLLTSSLRTPSHYKLLANDVLGYERGSDQLQDLSTILDKAKYFHFSDWPMGKPWAYSSDEGLQCTIKGENNEDQNAVVEEKMCEYWDAIYRNYLNSRKVCEL